LLVDNPGLKSELPEIFAKAYEKARVLATDATRFDEGVFPVEPSFTPFSFINRPLCKMPQALISLGFALIL
jgi:hypothetical protein